MPRRWFELNPAKAEQNRHKLLFLLLAVSPFIQATDDSVHRERRRRAISLLRM
jgi:hypothetical protein